MTGHSRFPNLTLFRCVPIIGMCFVLLATPILSILKACPLCEAMGSSISDDLKAPAIGVIAEVVGCSARDDGAGYDLQVKQFCQVGSEATLPSFDVIYSFDKIAPGKRVLMIGSATPSENGSEDSWIWNSPIELSQEATDYVKSLPNEHQSETERLCYFYRHLFSKESFVSDDAYCECARLSLESMRNDRFRQVVVKDELVNALRIETVPGRYKSFLWMVLSEVGSKQDAKLFRTLVLPQIERDLKLADRESVETATIQNYSWLAAAIACFAKLEGEDGLEFLETQILTNKSCAIGLKNATISAIRVLGAEMNAFASHRAARSLALVLDDTNCADLVIPDLARWEYWEALPALSKLFHSPESEEGMVRHLIVNYVRHCPLPEARSELETMKRTDLQAYRRAVAMLPTIESGQEIVR